MSTPRSTPSPVLDDGNEIKSVPSKRTTEETLEAGVYRIVNDHIPNSVIDLSGHDKKTIIAYGEHGGRNQQWKFACLGPGYSIQSMHNGSYITLASGITEGSILITTPYPVSWAVEPDDFEAGIYRIRWPMSPFVLDLPEGHDHGVQLSNRYPFKPTRLWHLVSIENAADHHIGQTADSKSDVLEVITSAPRTLEPGPGLTTNADTVIDVEGLKLGGNGEMSIRTTTTTVTTSVTVVKRIGIC